MATLICKTCGNTGSPTTKTSGSFLIELILWLCFLIPGLIYSIWRLTTKRKVCRHCGSAEMVPLDSPIGRRLAAESAPLAGDASLSRRELADKYGVHSGDRCYFWQGKKFPTFEDALAAAGATSVAAPPVDASYKSPMV